VGDARIVDENVEPAELVADPVRGGGDRGLIGDVELDRVRVAVDALCCRLTVREVARADQDGKAVLREILGDRESDPLLAPVISAIWLSCIVSSSARRDGMSPRSRDVD